jgi:hypothetical protein
MHIEEDSRLDHQKFYGQTTNVGHQTHFEEDNRLDFQPRVEQERNIDCRTQPEQKHQVCRFLKKAQYCSYITIL